MSLLDKLVAEPRQVDTADMPRTLGGKFSVLLTGSWLIAEERVEKVEKQLRELRITKDKLPYWTRHMLTEPEGKGLRTSEKGRWWSDLFLASKEPSKTNELGMSVATGMVWEMTRDIDDKPQVLTNKLNYEFGEQGLLEAIETVPDKPKWPMVVRVLIQDDKGEAVKFVDINVQKRATDENPFELIEWEKIMRGDEEYMQSIADQLVASPRYLREWYVQNESEETVGKFATPHILIGRNTRETRISQFTTDPRLLLLVGVESELGESGGVAGVSVAVGSHLSGVGQDMLGAKDSAYEMVMGTEKVKELLDSTKAGTEKVDAYRKQTANWPRNQEHFYSPLVQQSVGRELDPRQQIEFALRARSFENQEMLELAGRLDLLRLSDRHEFHPEIVSLLREIPNVLKNQKITTNRVFLVNMAIYLETLRAQGYAIGLPEQGTIAYAPVGSRALRTVGEARNRVVSEEVILNERINQITAYRRIAQEGEGIGTPDSDNQVLMEALDKVRQLYRADLESAKAIVVETDTRESEVGSVQDLILTDYLARLKTVEKFLLENLNMPEEEWVQWSQELVRGDEREGGLLITQDIIWSLIENRKHKGFKKYHEILSLNRESGQLEWLTSDQTLRKEAVMMLVADMGELAWSQFENVGIKLVAERELSKLRGGEAKELAEIEQAILQVTKSSGSALRRILESPRLSVVGINVRLGIMRKIEKLANWLGAGGVVGNMRPEENYSKILTNDPEGARVDFFTALASQGLTTGYSQENDGLFVTEGIDNPRTMIQVFLPYFRIDNVRKKNLLKTAYQSLSVEEYHRFSRLMSGSEYEYSEGTGWSSEYLERQRRATFNARERDVLDSEAKLISRVINSHLTQIEEQNRIGSGSEREMKDKLAQIWRSEMRTRLRGIETRLAEVLLIYAFVSGNQDLIDRSRQVWQELRVSETIVKSGHQESLQ